MERQPLTRRQQELFTFLKNEMDRTGVVPSLRATAAALQVSHTAIARLLRALEDKGWLQRTGRYSRTILLNREEDNSPADGRCVPVIGRVAAGLPLYAQQEWAGQIVVDRRLYRGENLFALRITGDSMSGVGILEGDLVICEPRQYAENGEIVVALLGEEATVKRFYYRGDRIELHPENDAYQATSHRLGDVLIQGRVLGLVRSLENSPVFSR